MIRDQHFFLIGIYRCSQEEYAQEIEQTLDELTAQSGSDIRQTNPELAMRIQDIVRQGCGGEWHFNQAIGWLELYVFGDQIRGDLWRVRSRSIRRYIKEKAYQWLGKAFELSFNPEESSTDINAKVLSRLEEIAEQSPFKGRYVDLNAFRGMGPHLDWRSLIGFSKIPAQGQQTLRSRG